jgi:hypothetical protein
MKPVMDDAHKIMWTCLVVAADLSFGGSYSHVSAGGAGVIGAAFNLAAFNLGEGDVMAAVFTTAGGSVGLTTSSGVGKSLQMGWSLGFLAKDPLNISGPCVDVAGQIGAGTQLIGPGFGFPTPSTHAPYVTARPTLITARYAYDLAQVLSPPQPSGSISIGGSYTWILQKIKA